MQKEQAMSRTEIDEDGTKYKVYETTDMFPALKDPEVVKKFNALESQEKEALNKLFFFMQSMQNSGEITDLKEANLANELIDNVADLREEKLKTLIGR